MTNPELPPLYEEPDYGKSRLEHTRDFLAQLPPDEQRTAQRIAHELQQTGGPLKDTVVIIPVAAHQESKQIAAALSQYAQQQSDRPFSVVLGLNSPEQQADSPEVTDSLAAVQQAQIDNPQLTIHLSFSTYETPVIGAIRRDIWNGVLAARDNQATDRETIGVNHDIDVTYLSPHYLQSIQRHYDRYYARVGAGDHLHEPVSTRVSHSVLPAYPHVGQATAWADLSYRQRGASYEAGMVFPLSYYAARGGFDPSARTFETGQLLNGIEWPLLAGGHLRTSPRRYIERFTHHGYQAIWTPTSFTADDLCRTESLAVFRDTPRATLRHHVETSLPLLLRSNILLTWIGRDIQDHLTQNEGALNFRTFGKELSTAAKRNQHIARAILQRLFGSSVAQDAITRHSYTSIVEEAYEQITRDPRG